MSSETTSPTISLPITDPEDLANAQKRVERLRKANSVLIQEFATQGAPIDFQVGMIHTMFEGLVEIGALREDQWLVIQMIWEERFNRQLTAMKGQFRAAVEQARVKARLAVPGRQNGAQQLIIPGT